MSPHVPRFVVAAAAAALLTACTTDDDDGVPPPPAGAETAWVVTTDYVDTVVARVDLGTGDVTDQLLAIASGDVGIWAYSGDVFVYDRTTGGVQRFADGDLSVAPSLDFSVGAATNPDRFAACDGRLYVSLYDAGAVGVFDPMDGQSVGEIDLSDFAEQGGVGEADGSGEPAAMFVDGTRLFVVLQRVDFNSGVLPDPVGKIVEIDCTTNEVVDSFDVGSNPSGVRLDDGGWVLVQGRYFELDGALVHHHGGSATALVEEADLGGDITAVAAVGRVAVFAAWEYGSSPSPTSISCVDLDTGVTSDAIGAMDANLWTLRAAPTGEVWGFQTRPFDQPELEVGIVRIDPSTCTWLNEDDLDSFLLPPTDASFQ